MGDLSLIPYPFTFKLLTAPLIDTYYIKSFGRRKTYIIPLTYLLGLACLLMSFFINDLVNNLRSGWLAFFGFAIVFIGA